MPLIIPSSSISGGYVVDNSCRFDSGSSDYINRTVGTATNNKKITFSFWVKRSKLTSRQMFVRIINPASTASYSYIEFDGTSDALTYDDFDGSSTRITRTTNQVFRDTSAWYHIVVAVDTTQATGSDRAKVYVNGEQVTSFFNTSDATQNYVLTGQTSGKTFYIGAAGDVPSLYLSGYLAEFVVIDGQQLDPTSFGEFDSDSGIWKPIDVSDLTYGTNGFYLPFENSGALGQDDSGNANNFTVNNLTSIDQTTDTPTNNYCTLNSLIPHSTPILYKDGNTIAYDSSANFNTAFSSMGISTGKWYFEAKTSTNNGFVGICKSDEIFPSYTAGVFLGHGDLGTNSWGYYGDSGSYFHNGSATAYGNSWTNTDMIGCALDLDNNKLYFSKNGTWQNSGDPTSGATGTGAISITSGTYLFGVTKDNESSEMQCNFGNPAFTITSGNSDAKGYGNMEYAIPSGYYVLNNKNLAEFG